MNKSKKQVLKKHTLQYTGYGWVDENLNPVPMKRKQEVKLVHTIEGPYQLLFRKKCCRCGRKFWTMYSYQIHYIFRHILNIDFHE